MLPKKSLNAQLHRLVPCTVAGIILRPIHHVEANKQVLKTMAMEFLQWYNICNIFSKNQLIS